MTGMRVGVAVAVVASLTALAVAVVALVVALTADAPPDGGTYTSFKAQYTKAFVDQAISMYEAEGRDATISHYSAQESVEGQWYVFIIKEDGFTIAHPNPMFLMRDPSLRVDATGHFYGDDILSATEAGRWVDYVLVNPATGENQQKHSWIVRHDGLLFGSGWYEK